MAYVGFMWECECGCIEYGENPPEECPKCYRIDSFIKLPEEITEEEEKEDFKISVKEILKRGKSRK